MKRMNRVIAFSALAALSLTLNPIQAGAYGETTKSTLTADTKAVSEYQTWKDSTWTGKESIDSGKIVLTPGATEKDLNFCWYSVLFCVNIILKRRDIYGKFRRKSSV